MLFYLGIFFIGLSFILFVALFLIRRGARISARDHGVAMKENSGIIVTGEVKGDISQNNLNRNSAFRNHNAAESPDWERRVFLLASICTILGFGLTVYEWLK